MIRPALLVVAALSSLAAAATDPIEGRWTVNGGGAVIEIARAPGADERFSVTMVDSPDLKVTPGTVLGYACPAPATGRYDCHHVTAVRVAVRSISLSNLPTAPPTPSSSPIIRRGGAYRYGDGFRTYSASL